MTALGLKACSNGYSVIFNASTLATELREAKDGYQLRKQENYCQCRFTASDELSYASFNREESGAFDSRS